MTALDSVAMSWTRTLEDRWSSRDGRTRLILRFVANAFFCYLLVQVGAFAGPAWVAGLTALTVLLAATLVVLRSVRSYDRVTFVLVLAMMVTSVVVNSRIDNLGSVYFVIGGIMLVGQPEVPVRLGIVLTSLTGSAMIATSVLLTPQFSVVVGNVFGVGAVILFGANRRQQVLRRQQDLALAARSTELVQRNAELEQQTEKTRQEAARVAALEERSRIARDLHDVLAHSLGGLVVQLDAAEAELSHGADLSAVAGRLTASRRLAVEGLREARSAVQELRGDPGLEPDGTVDAVDDLVRLVHGPVGVQLGMELDVLGSPRPVPARLGAVLVAVGREALTNVNKHAVGSPVSATLAFVPGEVRLEVVNGRGAGPGPVGLSDTGAGAGLAGLAERVAGVGGEFSAGAEGARWVVAATLPTEPDPLSGPGPRVEPAGPDRIGRAG